MLKETETEETIVFFVTFLSLVAFQFGRGRAPWPLSYAYGLQYDSGECTETALRITLSIMKMT